MSHDPDGTFQALKNLKKAKRARMISCQGTCGARFGTPTKVVPGDKCRHCGWDAPSDGHTWESWLSTQGFYVINP